MLCSEVQAEDQSTHVSDVAQAGTGPGCRETRLDLLGWG